MYHSGHDASVLLLVQVVPLHRVRFPRTGLPVRHDRPVEAVQDVVQHGASHLLEHLFLRTVGVETVVEEKGYLFVLGVADYELLLVADPVDAIRVCRQLLAVERTEPAENLYVALALTLHNLITTSHQPPQPPQPPTTSPTSTNCSIDKTIPIEGVFWRKTWGISAAAIGDN